MKMYQFKYQEILMNESFVNEERFLEQYKYLFEEILNFHSINSKNVYESINISGNRISSKPLVIETLLRKNRLPAFQFLVCKN
ncbi:hypothetical protein [Ferruginibacter sp. SUN106]|uniref:hypothetical protein n=1 Tax=Ferruginibacter sp. SUN106 TaxID=2978348 RepID=UPI003D36E318